MKSQHLPSKRLFIGSIPYRLSEGELLSIFIPLGKIVAVKILHNQWGRSRGIGYVEFENKDDAIKAKETMHGYSVGDLKIIVDYAEPDPFLTSEGKARHEEAVSKNPNKFDRNSFLPHPDSDNEDYRKSKFRSSTKKNGPVIVEDPKKLKFRPKNKARQSVFDSRNFGSHVGAKFAKRNKKKRK